MIPLKTTVPEDGNKKIFGPATQSLKMTTRIITFSQVYSWLLSTLIWPLQSLLCSAFCWMVVNLIMIECSKDCNL